MNLTQNLATYPLLDALRDRRSRRFGLGMKIEHGPFAYQSRHEPQPLSEMEEAALAFAACGITGYALADLAYGAGQGGSMLAGLVGRTISSADAINTVSLVITKDEATYLIKRPQEFAPAEIPDLIRMAEQGDLVEFYRCSRVKIGDGRAAPPLEPLYNFNINRWSLYAPGSSYFLPINEMTALIINILLEIFDEKMGIFVRDERANFQPAGIGRFARSKGGQLHDDVRAGRTATVLALEMSAVESTAIEQGMLQQNLGLMTQALGLGGFSNFARHEFGWFKTLGFRLGEMPASRYLGANWFASTLLGLLGRNPPIFYPLGLEQEGAILLKPFCPPYYPNMAAAVQAFVESKFGSQGVFRGRAQFSRGQDPTLATAHISGPSEAAIAATIAYCEYIYRCYGRFPAHTAPFRTVLGYQANHLDLDFYERFYQPEALTHTQRTHQAYHYQTKESLERKNQQRQKGEAHASQ